MNARAAIVTGGAQGIGKAIARRLLDDGISVVIADINDETGAQTETELGKAGTVHYAHADVADEQMVVDLVEQTVRTLGGIDILVNNAAASRGKPVYELSRAEWDRVIAVSLGPEVRVNCVSPGWIDTRRWRRTDASQPPLSPADHSQHPAGRVGRPEDIASLVAFLVSPDSGFMTGTNLIVDGGMTRKMIYVE